jgi:hypothetical protein
LDQEIFHLALTFLAGCVAGFINVLAGGGSLITLPMLIFLGLPSPEANATNRVGVFFQTASATGGFWSNKLLNVKFGLLLGLIALFGAILGAAFAKVLDEDNMNRVLSVLLVAVGAYILFGKKPTASLQENDKAPNLRMEFKLGLSFFAIGIYGGFIQAGTGFFIIAALQHFTPLNIHRINALKVLV